MTNKPKPKAFAGMTGILEFNSGTFYRYAGLNLDLLVDKDHLEVLSSEDRKNVVDTFLRATILAVPSARKNSMNANTLPGYVLGLVKETGQPLQLINAFENPVPNKSGLMDDSIARLKHHHDQLKETWGIKPSVEASIPDKSLDMFCKEIISHVV